MKVKITINNDKVVTARMEDSQAAKDFAALLPLTLTLRDFNPDLTFEIVMRRRRSFTGKARRRFWLKEYWNISMSKLF